jgi:hypothetical protein
MPVSRKNTIRQAADSLVARDDRALGMFRSSGLLKVELFLLFSLSALRRPWTPPSGRTKKGSGESIRQRYRKFHPMGSHCAVRLRIFPADLRAARRAQESGTAADIYMSAEVGKNPA